MATKAKNGGNIAAASDDRVAFDQHGTMHRDLAPELLDRCERGERVTFTSTDARPITLVRVARPPAAGGTPPVVEDGGHVVEAPVYEGEGKPRSVVIDFGGAPWFDDGGGTKIRVRPGDDVQWSPERIDRARRQGVRIVEHGAIDRVLARAAELGVSPRLLVHHLTRGRVDPVVLDAMDKWEGT